MQISTAQPRQSAYIFIDQKEQIKNYWTRRSGQFTDLRLAELCSPMAEKWMGEIHRYLPENQKLRILDIGTGSGFFAILLSREGHQVTGIDLTPSMIDGARRLNEMLGESAQFRLMDAECLSFQDESFDLIITRNLTWTLPNPQMAYSEWSRVLKPGGMLLNFDGNYGAADFTEEDGALPESHAHRTLEMELREECNRIKNQLAISRYQRPAWDISVLGELGFDQMHLDIGVSKRVYDVVDEFYNPTPMFAVCAVKNID